MPDEHEAKNQDPARETANENASQTEGTPPPLASVEEETIPTANMSSALGSLYSVLYLCLDLDARRRT